MILIKKDLLLYVTMHLSVMSDVVCQSVSNDFCSFGPPTKKDTLKYESSLLARLLSSIVADKAKGHRSQHKGKSLRKTRTSFKGNLRWVRKGKRAASSLKAFVFIFSEKLCSILQNLKGRVNHAVARNCETERFENPSRHLGQLLHTCDHSLTEQVFID